MRIVPQGAIGLLGKIPARGDFVRLNASGTAAETLFDWLQTCLERQMRDGIDMGPLLATFLFPVESAREVLLGVLVDSHDKVGRAFPLVVYQAYPFESCVGRLAALLHANVGRLEMMKSLVAEREGLEPAALAERASRVSNEPMPEGDPAAEEYQTWCDNLVAGLSSELGFMGTGSQQAARTALLAFVEACRPFSGRQPPKNPMALECPIARAEGASFWIALAERVLSWSQAAPGLLISHTGPARVLLTLGPLPAFSLSWLRNPESCQARVLALTGASLPMPSSPSPELEQMGTLAKFFASLRAPGIP